MINAIGSFLNHLQSRFTYRQRFLFFSLIYVLAIPFPAYWLFKTENFLIERKERQILGVKALAAMDEALHLFILQNPHLFPFLSSDKKDAINLIENEIERFNALNIQANSLQQNSISLGSAFSTPLYPLIQEEELTLAGVDLLATVRKTPFPLDSYKKIIERIPKIVKQLAKQFDLDLNLEPPAEDLSIINTELLPNALSHLMDLYFLYNEEIKNGEDQAIRLSKTVAVESLKQNLDQIKKIFKQIYGDNLDPAIPKLGFVHASIIDYRNAIEDFINILSTGDKEESDKVFLNAFYSVLKYHHQLWEQSQRILGLYYKAILSKLRLEKYLCLVVFIFATILVCLFVFLKILSRHLWAIYDHIQEMAKGNFKKCFCSDAGDEFGPVGLAFDKMGESVQNVVSELKKLGKQLTDSIMQITKTAKEQENIVADQEKNIKEIESTAKLIALNSRELANTMNDLSLSSKQNYLADNARSGLDRMHGEMSELTAASTNILTTLMGIQEEVASTKSIVAFMGRVSDQAGLLSLNSAIETTNVGIDKRGFTKITQEIQRFAENTARSMKDIKNIIKEMSIHVGAVRMDVNGCLREITEGVQRLVLVNQQLSRITKQGKEQAKKFESVNDVMQVQAFAAEGIIVSIDHLAEIAKENTKYTKILYQTTEELGTTARELQKVLDLFFTKT